MTAEELAEGLSAWHVHVSKGRDELRRLADEHGLSHEALFSATVRRWDKMVPLKEPTPARAGTARRAGTAQVDMFKDEGRA